MSVTTTQRNANRNQSTVDYLAQNIFTYGNRYNTGTFLNNSGASLNAQDGILVTRHATLADTFVPAIAGATLANVIGILKIEGVVTMADAASVSANYCLSGDIDAGMLILPATVTLDTVVGAKSLKDILTALGFVLNNVTELSKFDN